MDRSGIIYLIAVTNRADEYGIEKPTEGEPRAVMCQVESVTRAEFFDGGRNGLNPEYVFRMFFADYDGERLLIYNGNRFSVYRTYQGRGDIIELYAERKGGSNGN